MNHKTIARRSFLRGLGAAVALPALESLSPRAARANEETPPKRLLYYYIPNGFNMSTWAPSGTGSSYALSPMLAALEPHKEDCLFISGVDNKPANRIPGDAHAGAHYQQTAAFLTCTHVDKTPYVVGRSIDQVAAEALGYVTPHRSLALGINAGGEGSCSNGWPCAYNSFISWADAQTPIAKLANPQALFTTLFSSGAAGLSEDEFLARKARQLKVLDVVNEDAKALHQKLGVSDRRKLDQYLTAVNEAEDKVAALSFGLSCDPGDPPAAPVGYEAKIQLMLDMMVLAFQCDMTRVITFMTYSGGAAHGAAYDWVSYQNQPIAESKHTVSHHGGDPTRLGKLEAINTWEVAQFAYLVQRLKDATDLDGSRLLDNCLCLISSEMGDPDAHVADGLPVVLAGHLQGTIGTNRHLAYAAPENKFSDLLIGMLDKFGVSVPSFGDDGTHALPGLGV